ncbi:MAG: hypothetical protein AAGG81_08350, partial [Chlamydiota bacterium]
MSYISREYCCLDKSSEEILRNTLVNYLSEGSDRYKTYADLINKVVKDHQSSDFLSGCCIHLNATSYLDEHISAEDWKRVIGICDEQCSSPQKQSEWVEKFLKAMRHPDLPLEVIKSVLVLAGSSHFSRGFENRGDLEYVLRNHCGEEHLQLRIRNQGKLHTILLPYNHQKALKTVQEFMNKTASESASQTFSDFWTICQEGAFFEGNSSSRLRYLKKSVGGVPFDQSFDFGKSQLGRLIELQQRLLLFNRTGDKRILLDMYPLISEFFTLKDVKGYKEQLHMQIHASLKAWFPDADFSLFHDSLKVHDNSRVKVTWLHTLLELQNETLLPSIFKLVKDDFSSFSPEDHTNLLNLALKKDCYITESEVIKWVDFLWRKNILTTSGCIDKTTLIVSKMGGQRNIHSIENITSLVKELSSHKMDQEKNKKVYLSEHPAYNTAVSLIKQLLKCHYYQHAYTVLIHLPHDPISPSNTDLQVLWMQVLSNLIKNQQLELKQAVKLWEDGIKRDLYNIRFLKKDAIGHLISFAKLLLQSDDQKYLELGCNLTKELYNNNIRKEFKSEFSSLYSDYFLYLLKTKEKKEIEYATKKLKNITLTVHSKELIEDKQFEYLLNEKQFDNAWKLLLTIFSRPSSAIHTPKINLLLEKMFEVDQLTPQQRGQYFSVFKQLCNQNDHEIRSTVKTTPHLEKLLNFIKEYLESSKKMFNGHHASFVLKFVETLFPDPDSLLPETVCMTLSELVTPLLETHSEKKGSIGEEAKASLKRLVSLLLECKKDPQAIKLMGAMNLRKCIPSEDENFTNWIIDLTDREIERKDIDSDIFGTCIQLSHELLTHDLPKDIKTVEAFARICIHMVESSLDSKNIKLMHRWALKLNILLKKFEELEVVELDSHVSSWVTGLQKSDHIDDAFKIMNTFQWKGLPSNLSMTRSLVKARGEKKQYLKAIKLLKPYKKEDLENCEELKEIVLNILPILLSSKLDNENLTLVHQVLTKIYCLDLKIWNLYLDQCQMSQCPVLMIQGVNDFVKISKNTSFEKKFHYQACYAQSILITCAVEPKKSIDWVGEISTIWEKLSGDEAKGLRKDVTKTILLTAKNQLINSGNLSN